MINFNFISPTKVFFGKDKEKEVGNIISSYGYKNIAIVYGMGSIKKNGLYDKVINSLKENNINYYEVYGVQANPTLSFVNKAIAYLKDKNIDFILGIGGGSAIDTAKQIAHTIYYDGDPFDMNMGVISQDNYIPFGAIPTISAAGSELSDSCTITNDLVTPNIKRGFNRDSNRPLFAILNPEITYSVDKYQTACGVTDIMMHTLERYMNPNDSCNLANEFGFGLLRNVMKYGKVAIEDPTNYEARAELMLSCSYSHNGITGLGKKMFMRCHKLAAYITANYPTTAHGATLAVIWPAWCYYILDNKEANKQLEVLAKEVFNKETAKEGIDAFVNYLKEIGMPTTLDELGVDVDIEKLALQFSKSKTTSVKNDFKELDYQAFIDIYRSVK